MLLLIALLLTPLYYYNNDVRIVLLILLLCCLHLKQYNKENLQEFSQVHNILHTTSFSKSNIVQKPPASISKILDADNNEDKMKLKYTCELNKYIIKSKHKHPWNFHYNYIDIKTLDFVNSEKLKELLNIKTDQNIDNISVFTINNDKCYIYSYNKNIKNIKKDKWYLISIDAAAKNNKNINITPYISTSNHDDSTKPLSYDFFGFNYKKISSNKLTTLSWAVHINPDAKEDFDSLNFYINNGNKQTCALHNPSIKPISDIDAYLRSICNENNNCKETIGYEAYDPNNKIIGEHGICKFPFVHKGMIYNECVTEVHDNQTYSWCKLENNKKSYCSAPANKLIKPKKINIEKKSDGTVTQTEPDGTTREFKPDGTRTEIKPDGSVTKTTLYMNQKLQELVILIYKKNTKHPDHWHAYVEELNKIITKIKPASFETFLKELIKPLQNPTTLQYDIEIIRTIVAHCIQLFNKIHQNKYPHYEIGDIETMTQNIMKESIVIKKSAVKIRDLSTIKSASSSYNKTINTIIQHVLQFYNDNNGITDPVKIKDAIDAIIYNNSGKMKDIAPYINYDNIVDIIIDGFNYNNEKWNLNNGDKSSVFTNYDAFIGKIEEDNKSKTLLLLIKNDLLTEQLTDGVFLNLDDFIFNTIFLVMSIIIEIINKYNEDKLPNPINFELKEKNPNLNTIIIKKVNEIVIKILEPFMSTAELDKLKEDREDNMVDLDSVEDIEDDMNEDIDVEEIYENTEYDNIITGGLNNDYDDDSNQLLDQQYRSFPKAGPVDMSGVQGAASGVQGAASGVQGAASDLQGAASGVQGAASGMQGAASGGQGAASGGQGAASGVQGVASGVQGAASSVQGAASGAQGAASGAQGAASDMQGSTNGGQTRASTVIQNYQTENKRYNDTKCNI